MTEPTPLAPRFTLCDLPLPAKVVITCFLLAVGLGYTAALVQLHFRDSHSGEPMPTPADVVVKFTGKRWIPDGGEAGKPVSKFVKLITAPEEGPPFDGSGTMSPAFFNKCPEFTKLVRGPVNREQLRAEREGERTVLVMWAESPPAERQHAYEDDHFGVPDDKMPKVITPDFRTEEKTQAAVKVKSIIDARCVRCHKPGEAQDAFPLHTYAAIEKYLAVPEILPVPPGGGWVECEKASQIGLDKLTQSTHAHLLSFAVLFSLTGFVFAFTSYPTVVRCLVAPLALVAVVTDVCFWWLARLSDGYGMYFAMGVIGTGGAAGMGLGMQIVLSLWNMYGPKGKVVILLLLLGGGAAAGFAFFKLIDAKKQEAAEKAANARVKIVEAPKPQAKELTKFQRLFMDPVKGPDGKVIAIPEIKFKRDTEGGMVRALFDKDPDFKKMLPADQAKATPERHGEREALMAWSVLPDAERKKAFDADSFTLPPELAKKPVTSDYAAGGKVKIQKLINNRCVRCHEDESSVDTELMFDNYASLKKFLDAK